MGWRGGESVVNLATMSERSQRSLPGYLDFDLEIGSGSGREYPLTARSADGEARETLRFPFDELALENRLLALQNALLRSGGKRRQILSPEQQAVQTFGRALFDALFVGEVRGRYDLAQREAAREGKGLRVRLRIQPAALAALPWEFLYDPRSAEYVCLSAHTPLVRYIELPRPMQPLIVPPPLRILGLIASPAGLEPLDVTREQARVERAVAGLQERGLVELTWLPGQTWRDLQRAMRSGPWHIFHFIGHGGFDPDADEGLVALADDEGRPHHLQATHLGRLLADHRSLRLVLLNACEGARGSDRDIFSSTAAILVRRGLPAVIAMQYEITDRAAVEFSQALYESLADGLPVEAAVTEARKAISIGVANSLEWGTPVLYSRASDGLLFDLAAAPAPKTQAADIPVPKTPAPRSSASSDAEPATPRQPDPPPAHFTIESPIHLELVRVPAGEFLMGSDLQVDMDAYDNEEPQHRLHLPEFYIGKYPVTVAQFAVFSKATGHKTNAEKAGYGLVRNGSEWKKVQGADWRHPVGPQSDVSDKADHPVVQVSWHDALTFCRWLSDATGRSFRLPTEAEWEKAASWESVDRETGKLGGRKRIWPWGDTFDKDKCNTLESGIRDTTPVDRYPAGASPCGAMDMAGNVWEWTGSLWGRDVEKPDYGYPYDPADGREALDAPDDVLRVVRGGSWYGYEGDARCAVRLWDVPVIFIDFIGLRVVVSLSASGF